MIRVGRITYDYPAGGARVTHYPSYPNFKPVIVMTRGSPYGELGPYVLQDDKGRIMENIWQASKVYPQVPYSKQKLYPNSNQIAWEHPAEIHTDEKGEPNERYWQWRNKLEYNDLPVRYPVGMRKEMRATCLYCLKEEGGQRLNIAEAREQIYLANYAALVQKQPKFSKLQQSLTSGENLLILEVDGPHSESLDYYKQVYSVEDDFIEQDTMLMTPENVAIMLNDTKHSFGHGYCLAMTLLGWV